MAVFQPGVPIKTTEPTITVEKLPLGDHVFELVVYDDQGNASRPDRATVRVVRKASQPAVSPTQPVVSPISPTRAPPSS